MATSPARTVVSIDINKKASEETRPVLHTRWHPEIPPVASVKPGEIFKVECYDCSGRYILIEILKSEIVYFSICNFIPQLNAGAQIRNDDSVEDIISLDTSLTHILSGPIEIEGAMPGDALKVEILDVVPFDGHQWGFTCIYDEKRGGGGFLGILTYN